MLVSGNSIFVGNTEIFKVFQGEDLVWSKSSTEPDYLTFTILSAGTITTYHQGEVARYMDAQYSKNGERWQNMPAFGINVEVGDVVRLRGQGIFAVGSSRYFGHVSHGFWYNSFAGSAVFDISGNLLSMEYGSGFTGQTETAMPDAGLGYIFSGSNVHSAENLILPQSQSGTSTNILMGLFKGCGSLRISPVISNATFNLGCASMFEYCSSLDYIKCLAKSEGTLYATYFTLGVAATGTFVKAANATWYRGGHGIPDNWTIIEE